MAPAAARSALPWEELGVFRPPWSAPSATKGPRTLGSLPGQAGAQARCRAAATALGLASRTVASSRLLSSGMASLCGWRSGAAEHPLRARLPHGTLPPYCPVLLQPGRSPTAALSTDAGLPSLGPGLGGHRDKSWGSAACLPRAVPAETWPWMGLSRGSPPPDPHSKARPTPSWASAPWQGPLPRNLLCGGSPGTLLPARTFCRPSLAVHLCVRTAGLDALSGHQGCPEDPGGAVGPGSPSACPGRPCPPTTPRCHQPPQAGTCTTGHLSPQAPWLCLRSPEPPLRKPLGSWGSGVAAGVCTSYFPLQTPGRPGPPQTCRRLPAPTPTSGQAAPAPTVSFQPSSRTPGFSFLGILGTSHSQVAESLPVDFQEASSLKAGLGPALCPVYPAWR